MSKVLVVFSLLFSLLLLGCNGGQRVINNQYQVMGFPQYTVSDDLVYVGSPSLADNSYCSGADCQFFNDVGGRMTSDLFASTEGGVVKEVVAIQRHQTNTGYIWSALKGPKVRFAGKEYIEDFIAITSEKEGGAYAYMLKSKGYELDKHNMSVRVLVRNISNSNQVVVAYGCSESLIPEGLRNDPVAVEEFMRARFDERIVIPQ